MTHRIIIAGAGGQGIMLLGKVLAEGFMKSGMNITWLPSYGAEVRGGTANCMLTVSREEIGSPYVGTASALIIMNQPSLSCFRGRLSPDGLLIINSSLASVEKEEKARYCAFPFTEIASEIGSIKVANMVAAGCFIAAASAMPAAVLEEVIRRRAGSNAGLEALNLKALRAGIRQVREEEVSV